MNKKFSIITLKHDEKFYCKDNFDINNNNILIECVINKTPASSFPKNSTDFFDIYTEIKNNRFHLFIKPHKKQALFATPFDLKKNIAIPKERPKESKIWQIVGYENEIPFLSNKKYYGLNFPIKLPSTALPYIKELDINASPLVYNEGPDLNVFLSLREAYNNKNFTQSIALADNILQNFPDSIFIRDSLLYKIRSLNQLNQLPDNIIELAKMWIKNYSADTNVPEVLFIIGDSYSKLRNYNEARYYYNRIIDEYADSKYVQYANVGIANDMAVNGDKKQPMALYAKAYEKARDLDTASYVAVTWGQYEINNDNKKSAEILFSRVLEANPKYFLKDINKSYDYLKLLAENGLFEIAAKIGDSMLDSLPNDMFKERLMIDISNWYELAGKNEDAHRINLAFLETFKESNDLEQMKLRDDNLLFSLNENDINKQIEQYDYIISTYPNSKNSALAYEKKADALFKLGLYNEILNIKNNLDPKNPNINNAYIKLIENAKNCNDIIKYYLESDTILQTNNAESVALCLKDAAMFDKAMELSEFLLTTPLNTQEKLTWLSNLAQSAFKLNDFNKSSIASRDAFSLAKNSTQKQEMGVILFLSLANLNRNDEALKVYENLNKILPNDKSMLKVYNQLLLWAMQRSDNVAIEKYSKDIIRLQNLYKIYDYTPSVEINYADVLFADNRFSQMLEVLKNILSFKLSDDEIQKVRYLRGSAYYELGDNQKARNEIDECIKINLDSAYGKLCSEIMGLM